MIALHNLVPDLSTGNGFTQLLWDILHQKGLLPVSSSYAIEVLYPLMPWFAVMSLGWSLGPLFSKSETRRSRLVLFGSCAFALFLALRLLNIYGDPHPWRTYSEPSRTVISFFNVEKYPPSLSFLSATLGVCFLLLAAFDRSSPSARHPLLVFGRTPLFFYVVHLFMNILAAMIAWGIVALAGRMFGFAAPPIAGFPLWVVYPVWLALLVPLYFFCRAWLERKAPGKTWLGRFF